MERASAFTLTREGARRSATHQPAVATYLYRIADTASQGEAKMRHCPGDLAIRRRALVLNEGLFGKGSTPMESIYYVITWLCHRTCTHCYEDRFRPYRGDQLREVLGESERFFRPIVDNFPERHTYLDLEDADEQGQPREKVGRIVLAGGEVLLEPVRHTLLFPILDAIHSRYKFPAWLHERT